MAVYVMSYPVSMGPARFNTVLQGSDAYKAQQIKSFLRTEKNERSLMPDFGMNEPTFDEFDSGKFLDSFLNFYSANTLEIMEIRLLEKSGAVTDVEIGFK